MNDQKFYVEPFKGSVAELSGLFKSEYSKDASICNEGFLQWQYLENPCGEAIIICSRDLLSKDLVAVYIVNPVEYLIDTVKYKGALSMNTFTRRDFRGLGIFPKMAQLCYLECQRREFQFVIGFPNAASFPGFINKLGFKVVGDVPFYIKPINPIRMLLKKCGVVKSTELISFDIVIRQNVLFRELTANDDSLLNSFFNELGGKHSRNARGILYFKWRYMNHPLNKYRIIGFFKDNILLGYVVLNFNDNRWMRDGYIVDFVIRENLALSKDINFFLKVILDYLKRNGVDFVKTYANRTTNSFLIYRNNGFFPKSFIVGKSEVPFIFKSLVDDLNIGYNMDEWDIVLGDCDVV